MTAPLPESGSLVEIPLARLLLELYAARFTGRIELSRARTRKAFTLQDGALVGSESNLATEHLTAVLEQAGLLSHADRRRVDAEVRESHCQEGVALLSLELIDAKQLFQGLREQVRTRAIECFGWVDGRFSIEPSEERDEKIQPFRADPYKLVQQGLQNHWSLDRMLEALAPHMNEYVRAGERLGKVSRRLTLDASVERMIAGLSGNKTLGAVVGAAASSPAALAAFWVLDASGALSYASSPLVSASDDAASEIEIHISDAAASGETQAAGAASKGPAAESTLVNSPDAKASAAADKMRDEVLDRLERLDSLSFYELLGVARSAEHGAIRKAYFVAAKRYHPDAISRLGLHDIRSEAGEVFARIAEANEILSNPERRKAYDNVLDGGVTEIDVQVLAQAETFYRKGEILINMGDFRGALDYLKNAVELYPDEAVYQSDLGWAYYKKVPAEPEPAAEHIRMALKLEPEDAVAQFRLGVIERALEQGL